MNAHLKVIIPSYNSVKWIGRTLHSVAAQTYRNYEVCVIDDASTQAGQKELIQHYCLKYGWQALYRNSNQGALANIVEGIDRLAPAPQDVILLLDGDDWLFDNQVFSKIAEAYSSPSVLLTYGQFITYPRWQLGFCRPLTAELLQAKRFRSMPFHFSHLRTFRHKIWRCIEINDLKDASGTFYKTTWDLAIMYPLLEMTGGGGCKFIDQILYVYNMDNPLNDCIAHSARQKAATLELQQQKQPYPQLFFEAPLPYIPQKRVQLKNRWISLYKKVITPQVYLLALKKLVKKCTS